MFVGPRFLLIRTKSRTSAAGPATCGRSAP